MARQIYNQEKVVKISQEHFPGPCWPALLLAKAHLTLCPCLRRSGHEIRAHRCADNNTERHDRPRDNNNNNNTKFFLFFFLFVFPPFVRRLTTEPSETESRLDDAIGSTYFRLLASARLIKTDRNPFTDLFYLRVFLISINTIWLTIANNSHSISLPLIDIPALPSIIQGPKGV